MPDLRAFITGFKSVTLATIDKAGRPFSSYAPFVLHEKRFYIFISDIARHARNLKNDPHAALFFIEDESRCENIFARKRAVLQCSARTLKRDDTDFKAVMEAFKERFDPAMLEMLLTMKDFNLYELLPHKGEAVFGFGQAYDITGNNADELTPRRSGGHDKT